MSTQLTPVITQLGITTLIDAKNRGIQTRITHVAVGDGNAGGGSGPYTATDDMTALRNEVQRVIVAGGEQIGSKQNQLHLTATVQDEGVNVPAIYPIYEIGFFLETGELFAVYASPGEKLAEKVNGTDFLLAFDLTFTGAEAGNVVIDGRSQLPVQAVQDSLLLGPNVTKIHNQAEFDAVFNRGADTVIAANSTLALSPIEGFYHPNDTGRWQRMYDISAFAAAAGNKVTCTAASHGLNNGDDIVIVRSQHYNGNYSVSNVTGNSFDIAVGFIANGTAKWGSIAGAAYTPITAFADSTAEPGAKTTCAATGHGLKAGDTVMITQSRYYGGIYHLQDTINADDFDIDAVYNPGTIADGAWGGTGDNPQNTFNGQPAYILKNSILLSGNVSIIGFNQEDTLVVKANADAKIKVQGTSGAPVTGVRLHGWSFDGRGGVNGLGGTITVTGNGGGLQLDYCEDIELNCKIVNHKVDGSGGGIYGVNAVKRITATEVHHNHGVHGSGVFNCDDSTFSVYDCAGTSAVHDCSRAMLRLFNCPTASYPDSVVFSDNSNMVVGGGLQAHGATTLHDHLYVADGKRIITDQVRARDSGGLILWERNKNGIRIADGGNVGIGTGIPEALLHVQASGSQEQLASFRSADNDVSIEVRSDMTSSPAEVYYEITHGGTGTRNSWKLGTNDNTKLNFSYGPQGSMNSQEKVTIDTTGKVGIGTINPGAALSINGGLHVGGDADPGDNNLLVDGTTTLNDNVTLADGKRINTDEVRARDNGGLALYEDGGQGIFIKDGGQVGIGTVAPAAALSINGGLNVGGNGDPGDNNLLVNGTAQVKGATTLDGTLVVAGAATLNNDVTLANNKRINTDQIRARDNGGLALYEDGGKGIFIKDGGKVGIGTVAPAAALSINGGLHVGGDSNPGNDNLLVDGRADINSGVTVGGTLTVTGDTILNNDVTLADGKRINADQIRARDNGGLALYDDGGKGIFIQDGGTVGIGFDNPLAALCVNGGLNVGGNGDPGDNNLLVNGTLRVKGATTTLDGTLIVTGASTLNDNVTLADGKRINADQIRARDNGGLALYEDGGKGIFIKDGGNVGIGTSTPNRQLDINGTIGFGNGEWQLDQGSWQDANIMYNGANASANFGFYGPEAKTVNVIVDGKVGIHTATPGAALTVNGGLHVGGDADPGQNNALIDGTLQVQGATTLSNTLNFGASVRQMINLWADAVDNYGIGVQASTQYFRTAGNFAWFKNGAHNNNEFNAGTGGTVQMALNSQGRLGIGTTTDLDTELTVYSPGDNSGLTLQTKDNDYSQGIAFRNSGGNYTWYVHRKTEGDSNAALVFAGGLNNASITALNERMRINKDGNVGVGTNNPGYRLDVNGMVRIAEATGTAHGANAGTLILDHENNGGASSIVFRSKIKRGNDYGFIQYQDDSTVGGDGEQARLIIGTASDATDHVILSPAGNVGIGTNDPAHKLDVNGNIGFGGDAWQLDQGSWMDANIMYNGANASANFGFHGAGTKQLNLIVDGKVGIHTTTPQAALSINGGLHVGGNTDPGDNNALVQGTLQVNGATTLNTLQVNGLANIADTLNFSTSTRQMINLWAGEYGIGIQAHTQYFRTNGNFAWFKGGTHNDNALNAGSGGTRQMSLDDSGNLWLRGNLSLNDRELRDVRALQMKDWDSDTGGSDNTFRLLVRDSAFMFYNGGVVVGAYGNNTFSPQLSSGTLIVQNELGIGTTTPSAPLSIGPVAGKHNAPDASMHITSDVILFGGRNAGKEKNSAQISAGLHMANSLNIVGMSSGTSGADRKIDLWAEGGATVYGRIRLVESTGTTHNPNTGTLILDHNNSGGASSIVFRSTRNRGSDYGYIQYQDDQTIDGSGESARLIIGIANDADDDLILAPSGSVGIGTLTPGAALSINGGLHVGGDTDPGDNNAQIAGTLQVNGVTSLVSTLDFSLTARQMINLWEGHYGIGIQSATQYFRTADSFAWFKGGSHNDGKFNPGGGTVQMVLDASGRLGLGTASSLDMDLTVCSASTNNGLILKTTDNAYNQGIAFRNAGDAYTWYMYRTNMGNNEASLVFAGGNTESEITALAERMRIDNNGNVGIGTTTPQAPLSIGPGDGKHSSPDTSMHITSDVILFGGRNAGKEVSSAQISAGLHVANSLNIIGMSSGTSWSDRKIDLWAEGGATINGKVRIYEATGTTHSGTNGTLVLEHGNSGGASSIVFPSRRNNNSDYAYIQYQDDETVGGAGESAKLIIGIANDAADDLILAPSGNVGIGTTNPEAALSINGGLHVGGDSNPGDNNAQIDGTLQVSGATSLASTLSFGASVRQMINLWNTSYGIGVQSHTQYFRTAHNFAWYKGGSHNDGQLNPGGGTMHMSLDATGNLAVAGAIQMGQWPVAARVSGEFTVGGADTSFYPVLFSADEGESVSQELMIYRDNVHADANWKGSFYLKLSFHPSNYGHFEMGAVEKVEYRTGKGTPYHDPVGDIQDGSTAGSQGLVVWLRGGGTYKWRSPDASYWSLINGNSGGGSITDSSNATRTAITAQTPLIVAAKNNVYINNGLTVFSAGDNGGLSLKTSSNSFNQGIAFRNSGDAYTWYIYRTNMGSNNASLVFAGGNSESEITALPERMRITNGGYVGIGQNNPQYPLDIGTYAQHAVTSYGYLNAGGNTNLWRGSNTIKYSIHAAQRIRCPEFNAISDARIKQIDRDSDPREDLHKLLALQVKDYHYTDKLQYGEEEKKGLIAQQVEAVFPQAVQQGTDFIPDIFVSYSDIEFRINQSRLTLRLPPPDDLKTGDKVRFIIDGEGTVDKTVTDIAADKHEFTVSDWDETIDRFFVYGRQVDDFRTIDYDRILMLSISAAQVHEQRVQQLEQEKATLQSRVEQLEQNYDDLKAQIAHLLQ